MTTHINTRITAAEFLEFFGEYLRTEAWFTETNNENQTLGDYLADVATLCERMIAGEHGAVQA